MVGRSGCARRNDLHLSRRGGVGGGGGAAAADAGGVGCSDVVEFVGVERRGIGRSRLVGVGLGVVVGEGVGIEGNLRIVAGGVGGVGEGAGRGMGSRRFGRWEIPSVGIADGTVVVVVVSCRGMRLGLDGVVVVRSLVVVERRRCHRDVRWDPAEVEHIQVVR